MSDLLTLATENAELRLQLAETQEQCIELAVDAGELNARIEALQQEVADLCRDRDTWRSEATQRKHG